MKSLISFSFSVFCFGLNEIDLWRFKKVININLLDFVQIKLVNIYKSYFFQGYGQIIFNWINIYLYRQSAIFHTYYVCTEDVSFAKKIHYNGLSKLG